MYNKCHFRYNNAIEMVPCISRYTDITENESNMIIPFLMNITVRLLLNICIFLHIYIYIYIYMQNML